MKTDETILRDQSQGPKVKEVQSISSNWTEAIRQLWDLRDDSHISSHEWEVVISWLANTEFDEQSFLAAETAIGLIQDRAPFDVRQSIEYTAPKEPGGIRMIRLRKFETDRNVP